VQTTAGINTPLRRGLIAAAGVAGIALTVWLRARAQGAVFVGGEVFVTDTDCYYHLRRALLTLEHFPTVPLRDPWLAWPRGAIPTWGPGFDLFLALPPRLLGLTSASPRAPVVIAWVPVFAGALTAALASLTAARLEPSAERRAPVALAALVFAAALPTSVHITQVGAVDHHMIESIAPLLALLWVTARRAWSPLRWELAGGALLASMTYLFSGTMATHALLAAGLALSLVAEARPLPPGSRWLGGGALAYASGAALLTALSLPWVRAHGQWFHHLQLSLMQPLLLGAGAALLAAATHAAAAIERDTLAQRAPRRAWAATWRVAAPLALGLALFPALRRELVAGVLDWLFTRDPWMAAIAECRPLFAGGVFTAPPWRRVFVEFSALGPLLIALLPLALARLHRRRAATTPTLAVVVSGLLLFTMLQQRFGRALAGPIAPVAALGLAELVDVLARRRAAPLATWAPLAIALVWLGADGGARAMFRPAPAGMITGLLEGAVLLRDRALPPGRGAAVLTFSSYGSEALYLARRPVVVSGFGPYLDRALYEESSSAWRSSEQRLFAHLTRRDAGHVLATTSSLLNLGAPRDPRPFRRTGDGREVLNDAYFQRFPVAVMVLAGSGNARHAMRHLEHLRPVFAGGGLIGSREVPLPDAWAYERVAGARVTGEAPDGALIRATLAVTVRGRARQWEAWTRASQGAWALVVPLATATRERYVTTGERYVVTVAEREIGTLTVTLDDVRGGRAVTLAGGAHAP
jgi:asparagine N-glycosylation enzyme membrane subunit Stt3